MSSSESATPEISVVVPSYMRETRLAFTLEALASQTLDSGRYEVIVVRDSDDGPLAAAPPGLDLRCITQPAPGPAMRRNRGWREARADHVAFTDDDCRPAPDWLERILAASAGDDVILQGRTEPDPDEVHLYQGLARSMRVFRRDRWFPTCNITYPRALLERLGGFDEELAFFGEDTDLGLRAEELGARLVYVDEAVVWHAVHVRGVRAALRDATQRHAEATVLARHPEHRDELYLGAFVSEEHARLTLALVGTTLLRQRPGLALLAAYPFFALKLAKRPLLDEFLTARGVGRLVADVASEAIVETVEIAMRLRTSIRRRTLVL